jgi:phage baseplate assembly protein gpV
VSVGGYEALRRIVREELRALRLAGLAVVQETHPHAAAGDDDNYACTVRMRDTDLVLARVPVVAARKGMAAIPDAGDLVLVQFLDGDENAPVIAGSLYNDEDRPPPNAEGDVVLRLPVDAGEGEGVAFRLESASATAVTLALGGALKLELKDDDPVVKLDVKDGSATLTIASDGTVTIKTGKAIALEGGDVSIKGNEIKVEAQGGLKLKGATIDLN